MEVRADCCMKEGIKSAKMLLIELIAVVVVVGDTHFVGARDCVGSLADGGVFSFPTIDKEKFRKRFLEKFKKIKVV